MTRGSVGGGSLQKGFTLIEVIIVVSLLAFVMSVAFPNLMLQTEAEINNSLTRFVVDFRAACDRSILTGRQHRLAVNLVSAEYWLEDTDSPTAVIAGPKEGSAIFDAQTPEEAKEKFEDEFKRYAELAGTAVKDDKDKEIAVKSPVLNAKNKLTPPKWSKVENEEWKKRGLSPSLIIKDMKGEHNPEHPDTIEGRDSTGAEPVGYVYIDPSGVLEKAVIHIFYRLSGDKIDEEKTPYTLVTHPYVCQASVTNGAHEIDVMNPDADADGPPEK